MSGNFFNSTDHIRQFADTGRLDDHPVRMILRNDLFQRLAKIAYQAAANTAGVHLRNIDAGILQETAVNTDLTELILDKD